MKQATKKTMRLLLFFIIATIMISASRMTVFAYSSYEYKLADEQIALLQAEYQDFQNDFVTVHQDYLPENMPSIASYQNAVNLHDDVTAYWELQSYKEKVVSAVNKIMQDFYDKLVSDYQTLNFSNNKWNETEKTDVSNKMKSFSEAMTIKEKLTPKGLIDLQTAYDNLVSSINTANKRVDDDNKKQQGQTENKTGVTGVDDDDDYTVINDSKPTGGGGNNNNNNGGRPPISIPEGIDDCKDFDANTGVCKDFGN